MREAAWTDRILLLLGSRRAVRVSGHSMRPLLSDGDVVLVKQTSEVAIGDVVLASHPFKTSVTILKRVVSMDDAGNVELVGDDPSASSDSRSFGSIPMRDIRGKVVCRLKRSQ